MKILIATDGSDFSREAIYECCRKFADAPQKTFKKVSVYENVYPIGEPFAVSAEYYQQIHNDLKKQAENVAAEAKMQIREHFPDNEINLTTEIANGSPDRAIIETAKEWKPDLIVVGSHGRGFWGRVMLGSVSDAVLHHAPCSVMVVRRAKQQDLNRNES